MVNSVREVNYCRNNMGYAFHLTRILNIFRSGKTWRTFVRILTAGYLYIHFHREHQLIYKENKIYGEHSLEAHIWAACSTRHSHYRNILSFATSASRKQPIWKQFTISTNRSRWPAHKHTCKNIKSSILTDIKKYWT